MRSVLLQTAFDWTGDIVLFLMKVGLAMLFHVQFVSVFDVEMVMSLRLIIVFLNVKVTITLDFVRILCGVI